MFTFLNSSCLKTSRLLSSPTLFCLHFTIFNGANITQSLGNETSDSLWTHTHSPCPNSYLRSLFLFITQVLVSSSQNCSEGKCRNLGEIVSRHWHRIWFPGTGTFLARCSWGKKKDYFRV